jgi:photosystem II stability/assembly factor-like uncharacterized protein
MARPLRSSNTGERVELRRSPWGKYRIRPILRISCVRYCPQPGVHMCRFKFARRLFLALPAFIIFASQPCLGLGWESIGPYGGHAQRMVIHPNDPRHLYVTTKNGKIYRTLDAGERWEGLPFGLSPDASLNALVLDPAKPSVLYAGVAQNSATFVAPGEAGIYKSEDEGLHWSRLQPTKGWSVLSLTVSAQSEFVLAGTEDGVFQSDDAGGTWRRISPVNHPELKAVVSLAVDPFDPRVIYAGTPHLPWKTMDGGGAWESIRTGLLEDSDIFSIAIDWSSPKNVVIGACSGIYKSISAGLRWAGAPSIPESSRRVYQVVQDPVNAGTFYAATDNGLWKSADRGVTWKRANPYPYVVNAVVIDPSAPQTLYMATDRSGIMKSLDGGATFEAINQGFVNRNVSRLVSEDILYISSVYDGDFGGMFTTKDQGLTWVLNANQKALLGRNVISLAVAPTDPQKLFAGTYDGLLQSTDGGKTWLVASGSEELRGKIYDVSFSDPDTVYAATGSGLFESEDRGATWRKNDTEELRTAIYKVSTAPEDRRLILAQTSHGVLLSQDQGASWRFLNFGADQPAVYDFSFGAGRQAGVFAATSRGLLYSDDGGWHWRSIAGGLPPSPLQQVFLPRAQPEEVYALSRTGNQIWRSIDAGATWLAINNSGLEGASLLSLGVTDGQLFAVTENYGVFRFDAATVADAP